MLTEVIQRGRGYDDISETRPRWEAHLRLGCRVLSAPIFDLALRFSSAVEDAGSIPTLVEIVSPLYDIYTVKYHKVFK
jgi:hypothetical protein